jgi:hypothetical protein
VSQFDFDALIDKLAGLKLTIDDLYSKGRDNDLTHLLYGKYLKKYSELQKKYLELQGDRQPQEFERLLNASSKRLRKIKMVKKQYAISKRLRKIKRLKKKLPTDWDSETKRYIARVGASDVQIEAYARANFTTCEEVVAGRDLYSGKKNSKTGARVVVNISSAHIPAFCEASRNGEQRPYKNGYDLGWYHIGSERPSGESLSREIVDDALPVKGVEEIYFGAVELTGAGIRFYGDVCLVLDPSSIAADTIVLDRNSFDLISSPIREIIDAQPEPLRPQLRRNEAAKLAGWWKEDLGAMAALKVLQVLGLRTRRYTIGQIAEVVRHDEDYMEVLKKGSFDTTNLQEARISAADAAHDALTGDRTSTGPAPRLESLVWRHRRRVAEDEFRREGVTIRVVTSSGRTRD